MRIFATLIWLSCILATSAGAFNFPSDLESINNLPVCDSAAKSRETNFCVKYDQCVGIRNLLQGFKVQVPGDVALYLRDTYSCDPGSNVPSNSMQYFCCPRGQLTPQAARLSTPGLPNRDRDECELASASPDRGRFRSLCIPYADCSPFLQMLSNLSYPFGPQVPQLLRSTIVCDGRRAGSSKSGVPHVCCPEAATLQVTTTPAPKPTTHRPDGSGPQHSFSLHPNIGKVPPIGECGVTKVNQDTRIVGGTDAKIGQFPWLANIGFMINGKPDVLFKCGGTIISEKYILTAAHCVARLPRSFIVAKIRVGEHDLRKDPDCNFDCDPVQEFVVDKLVPHENYSTSFQNDIALIKIRNKIRYSAYVQPICLPLFDDEDEQYVGSEEIVTTRAETVSSRIHSLFTDDISGRLGDSTNIVKTQVAGWGATDKLARQPADVLQYLDVDIFDVDECRAKFVRKGIGVTTGLQICAGGKVGQDSCKGDSGAPLIRQSFKGSQMPYWRAIGVVSFGPTLCGLPGIPGVYTRVREYVDWILDNID